MLILSIFVITLISLSVAFFHICLIIAHLIIYNYNILRSTVLFKLSLLGIIVISSLSHYFIYTLLDFCYISNETLNMKLDQAI